MVSGYTYVTNNLGLIIEMQDVLGDEKFSMIIYIDYIVSEVPEGTNIIFDMERTPKIINYILLGAKYYENDISKITNFLKENNKEEKNTLLVKRQC